MTPTIKPDPNEVDPLVADPVAVGDLVNITVDAVPRTGGIDVTVGGKPATVIQVEGTTIKFVIPAGLGAGTHTVVATAEWNGEVLATKSIEIAEPAPVGGGAPGGTEASSDGSEAHSLEADP